LFRINTCGIFVSVDFEGVAGPVFRDDPRVGSLPLIERKAKAPGKPGHYKSGLRGNVGTILRAKEPG
jgi:hypothetical protein